MRDPRLIHLRGPLTHCCEKKKESVNQFAKIGKLCSESTVIKKFSIITEVATITALFAAFDAKALNCTELLESYLAGENRIINCHRQSNRNRHNWNIWHSTWFTLFIRITSVFSYLYCKKTNTLHLYSMRGGTKTLKHNVRTTLQFSYHGCKYLTHTSKTRHVKRTCRDWRLLVIAEVPTSWGVNLVVAGAQVGLPTKQPDVLKLPSQSKAKQRLLFANNSPVVL